MSPVEKPIRSAGVKIGGTQTWPTTTGACPEGPSLIAWLITAVRIVKDDINNS